MHDNLMYCICTAHFKRHVFAGSYDSSLFYHVMHIQLFYYVFVCLSC